MSKLSREQLRALECSIEDCSELAENYRFKNVFSDIYRPVRQGIGIGGLGSLAP